MEPILTNQKYGDYAIINEYKGSYSLVAGKHDEKKGEVSFRWFKPDRWDKEKREFVPTGKSAPLAVALGEDLATAIGTVEKILAQLRGKYSRPAATGNQPQDQDIPF